MLEEGLPVGRRKGAQVTPERLLASVRTQVAVVGSHLSKSCGTHAALEGLLAAVPPQVNVQDTRVVRNVRAVGTLE